MGAMLKSRQQHEHANVSLMLFAAVVLGRNESRNQPGTHVPGSPLSSCRSFGRHGNFRPQTLEHGQRRKKPRGANPGAWSVNGFSDNALLLIQGRLGSCQPRNRDSPR
jgi:hypothetical protein